MHDHIKHGRMKRTTDTSTVCLRQNDSMKCGLMNPGYSLLILLVSAFVVLIAACTGTSGKEQATGRQYHSFLNRLPRFRAMIKTGITTIWRIIPGIAVNTAPEANICQVNGLSVKP